MEQLCFTGNYRKRFARMKEFSNEKIEIVLDEWIQRFCNNWLEKEFELQSGAEKYQRSAGRADWRAGHYRRMLITARGVIALSVPRGERKRYRYSLFKKFKRKTEQFEDVVIESLLKGHSSRKASKFFAKIFGVQTISHQSAVASLRKFDHAVEQWKKRPLRNDAMVIVLDAVWLRGTHTYAKNAQPILFAYGIYPDGSEEVLDFEIARGESLAAWSKFIGMLYNRGLTKTRLVVHDDCPAFEQAIALYWPESLNQRCVYHVIANMQKKLKGWRNKRAIMKDVSWLYEAQSKEEFDRWLRIFIKRYACYKRTAAFGYFLRKVPSTAQYFDLPREYWRIAKTSNRLERFFEELQRRIKVFRRFPNSGSCKRWLYALITEIKPNDINVTHKSQHSS